MKKGVIFAFLFLVLGASVLVSAFSFSNLFNPTGKAVWEITEPTGICLGDPLYNEGNLTRIYAENCMSYNSRDVCISSPNHCYWENDFEEFMDNSFTVNEGWNLIWGLFYPGQISSGDIAPSNIKQIYTLNPFTKEYFELFPNFNAIALSSIASTERSLGYWRRGDLGWITLVYFDKEGSFKFRLPDVSDFGTSRRINDATLIQGWNFLGVIPAFYFDVNGVKQTSFTLNNIKGNCNIEKAYFFTGGNFGEWNQIALDEAIPESELLKSLAIKVTSNCNLGRIKSGFSCIDTDGITASAVQGNVKIYQNGQEISSQTDSCETPKMFQEGHENQLDLLERDCSFGEDGTVEIKNLTLSAGSPWCQNGCVNGACV